MPVPSENILVDGSISVASYKPKTEMDYGTLLCWADNELGRQSVPCVYHVIPAGKNICLLKIIFLLVNFSLLLNPALKKSQSY